MHLIRKIRLLRRFSWSLLILACSLPLLCVPRPGSVQEESSKLRVKITLEASHLELSFHENYRLLDKTRKEAIPVSPGRYAFISTGGLLRMTDRSGSTLGNYPGPLYLQPEGNPVDEAFFVVNNAVQGEEYRGALHIQAGSSGVEAINVLDLESYLRGVVSREMPPAWGNYGGMHALQAQAVASRTYALYYQVHNRHEGYDLCDTEHCQFYGGKKFEAENTDRAVRETRGEILTYQGDLIAPYYHATNGGFTELTQNVWTEPLPYIKSVHDPYDDPDNPQNIKNMVFHNQARWITSLTMDELESRLSPGMSGKISKVEVISRFPSGRVEELQVRLVGGEVLSYYKGEARSVLGLRSQLFHVHETTEKRVWLSGRSSRIEIKEQVPELEGKWALNASGEKSMLLGESFSVLGASGRAQVPLKSLTFEGRGWGHGIGMSQYGAYNRARDGHDYREILSFYYPGTELTYR